MAKLYAERIDSIDPPRATLVTRAINTVDASDVPHAQYEADSIVQSFVNVCIHLVHYNDLAASAFPADDD